MPYVLLVEDDRALREVTAMHLRAAGHRTEAVADGAGALRAIEQELPDIVVLDLMLPEIDGLEVCRRIRSLYQPGPGVVMVTARSSDADMVIGLDAGADDYVVKPFAPPVLLARIAAVTRRLAPRSSDVLTWSEIRIDMKTRKATARGNELGLTATEFALLARFCSGPGEVFTRKQLLEEVFHTSNEGYARNVDCHVTRLRRKLERAGWSPAPIHAVHGTGYRLGDS